MSVKTLISSTGTVAAIAATAFFNPYQVPTTSGVTFSSNENVISRVKIVEETNSSKQIINHIQTHRSNWHQITQDLFGSSRGFTSEEATMHANALKAVSTVKGKRFEL